MGKVHVHINMSVRVLVCVNNLLFILTLAGSFVSHPVSETIYQILSCINCITYTNVHTNC